jgi:hypothetical protein
MNKKDAKVVKNSVTRLGEFLPFGWLLFWRNLETCTYISNPYFWTKYILHRKLNLQNMYGLGYTFLTICWLSLKWKINS